MICFWRFIVRVCVFSALTLPTKAFSQDHSCIELIEIMLGSQISSPLICSGEGSEYTCGFKMNSIMSKIVFFNLNDIVDVSFIPHNTLFLQCGLAPCIDFIIKLPPDLEILNAQTRQIPTSGVESVLGIDFPYIISESMRNALNACQ